MVLGLLQQACRNEFPAWALDHALLIIAHRKIGKDAFQLCEKDRDEILRLFTYAKALLPKFIPEYPAKQFAVGLDAAAMQVILWSETEEEQALRHPDTKRDAADLALVLRQAMYNLCLIERVQERRQKRQAETISELIQPFRMTGIL